MLSCNYTEYKIGYFGIFFSFAEISSLCLRQWKRDDVDDDVEYEIERNIVRRKSSKFNLEDGRYSPMFVLE